MADVRENQMAVGSAQYLRGISSNGSSVRVDNIMNTISKISTTEILNCDDFISEGRYSGFKWSNCPYTDIAVLEVIKYSEDWILQKLYAITSDTRIYVRCFTSGRQWGNWKQVI